MRDPKAMRRLEYRIPGVPGRPVAFGHSEFEEYLLSDFQLRAQEASRHIELGPDLEYLWFPGEDVAALRAPYERSEVVRGGAGDPAPTESRRSLRRDS